MGRTGPISESSGRRFLVAAAFPTNPVAGMQCIRTDLGYDLLSYDGTG